MAAASAASPQPLAEERTSLKVWLVVALTVMAQLLFAGNIFGFASLQLLLESDDVFLGLCAEDEPLCAARLQTFVLLFTICCVVVTVSMFPAGRMADVLGPVGTCALGAACEGSGLWLFGASGRDDQATFIAAGVLCALGSSFILLCGVPLAFIVHPSSMPLVMSLSSNAFDASAVVFLILYQLQSAFGVSRFHIFVVYSGVCVMLLGSLALAWMSGPLAQLRAKQRSEATVEQASPAEAEMLSKPPFHGKSFGFQIFTFEFFFITITFFVNVFLSNSYLGLNKAMLESLGDAETEYFYASLFMAFMSASCLCAPAISFVLRKFGFGGAYGIICVSCFGFLCFLMVPSLPLQTAAFLIYSCYRSTFYSTHFTFLAYTFGSRTSSSIMGLVALISSLGQFLIYAFTGLVSTFGSGQLVLYYFAPCLATLVPFNFMLLWSLRRYLKRVQAADCRYVEEHPKTLQCKVAEAEENGSSTWRTLAPIWVQL